MEMQDSRLYQNTFSLPSTSKERFYSGLYDHIATVEPRLYALGKHGILEVQLVLHLEGPGSRVLRAVYKDI
jgi:hypothetical protein